MLKHSDIVAVCELCQKPTNVIVKLGDLADKISDLEIPGDNKYKMGLCSTCKSQLEAGAAFFCDVTGRVLMVSVVATKEKLKPEYHGKIIKVPASAMDELMKVYNDSK